VNTPIRYLAVGCLVLFLALMGNVTFVQFVHADSLNSRGGNRRVIDEEFARDRGAILVAGAPIAQSVPSRDRYTFQRTYPKGELYAPLTGYFSYIYGNNALENSQNKVLSGSDNRLFVSRVVDLLSNQQPKGGSVELTIDPLAQSTAASGLAALGRGTRGAVAAIDADTGAILAMVSQPSYNPNVLASHDFTKVTNAWKALDADTQHPLINRATQQTLPPGSVFKLVTAAAALDKLHLKASDQIRAGSSLSFPGIKYKLTNLDHSNCGGQKITFERALDISCNVAFGALAGRVGESKLVDQAAKFGFGSTLFDELPVNASHVVVGGGHLEAPQLAQSGIGQYNVGTTPLQMALVAAGIANDGVVMRPYLVKTVRGPDLRVIDETKPERFSVAMSRSDARTLQDMMQSVVQQGTGVNARIPGVEVGGKTGTAQRDPSQPPYAWFVAFARSGGRTIAVAVVVEASSTLRSEIAGGHLSAPIARAVIQAVLQ
jgi:peptidoglycan glycosyltransferase